MNSNLYGSSTNPAGSSALFVILAILALAVTVLVIVGLWKVFTKAGKPGWAAIIPIYNLWVLFEIIGRPGWWSLILLAVGFIPVVGGLVALVAGIFLGIELAKAFGKSPAFGVIALWLFSIVGFLILGFGDAKYVGPPTQSGSNPTPPATPAK